MKPLLDINFGKWAAEVGACWGPLVRLVKLSHRVLPVTKGAPVLARLLNARSPGFYHFQARFRPLLAVRPSPV